MLLTGEDRGLLTEWEDRATMLAELRRDVSSQPRINLSSFLMFS